MSENAELRKDVSPDADNFANKLISKFAFKKNKAKLEKEREEEPVKSIAEGHMPEAGVKYNITEVIQFMEIYELIRNSRLEVLDDNNEEVIETFETDGFTSRDVGFREYAHHLFQFDIETVPLHKMTLPLSADNLTFVLYKDTGKHDVVPAKDINPKKMQHEFTSYEIAGVLEMLAKEGLSLKSFKKEVVGKTYAGKTRKGN